MSIEVHELDVMECIEMTGSYRIVHFEMVENDTVELATLEANDGDE